MTCDVAPYIPQHMVTHKEVTHGCNEKSQIKNSPTFALCFPELNMDPSEEKFYIITHI